MLGRAPSKSQDPLCSNSTPPPRATARMPRSDHLRGSCAAKSAGRVAATISMQQTNSFRCTS
uniref:Uncharacterized protein n=1 Tax=Arundo donax TaxID=35708 RepID=A0A0A9AV40_ARUDO